MNGHDKLKTTKSKRERNFLFRQTPPLTVNAIANPLIDERAEYEQH